MTLLELLEQQREGILSDAVGNVRRARLEHYEQAGAAKIRESLETLYDFVASAIREKNLAPLLAYMQRIAGERYLGGFDLSEVQTAINVLEESVWIRITRALPLPEYAEAFGLIGTVLGAGKDMLARTYVELVCKGKAPSLNLQSLFSGVAGA